MFIRCSAANLVSGAEGKLADVHQKVLVLHKEMKQQYEEGIS